MQHRLEIKEDYRRSLHTGTYTSLRAKTGMQSRLVRQKTIKSLSKRRFWATDSNRKWAP